MVYSLDGNKAERSFQVGDRADQTLGPSPGSDPEPGALLRSVTLCTPAAFIKGNAISARVTSPPLGEDLASRIREGSSESLEQLYRAVGRRLYALAWRLTGSRADAEDIVHDVFVGLPRALEHYRERGRLEAWLKRLIVRTVWMRRRSRGRQAQREAAYAEEHTAVTTNPHSPAGDADALLATLPEPLRAVVVMREIEGMSHAEIAKALGISEAASRLRLFRGLERLRKTIAAAR